MLLFGQGGFPLPSPPSARTIYSTLALRGSEGKIYAKSESEAGDAFDSPAL